MLQQILHQYRGLPQPRTGRFHIQVWGGSLLISCSVAGYASTSGTRHSVSLYRAGTHVAENYFLFQNGSTHMAMPPNVYIDNSGSTSATTWSLNIDSGMTVDSSD